MGFNSGFKGLINSTFEHTTNMSVDSEKREKRRRKKTKEGKVFNPTHAYSV